MALIVVANDDEGLCRMLAADCGAAGFDVLLAEDGSTALSLVREQMPTSSLPT